ncbi:MAG: hypothetical protein K0R98_68 [Rickettsiaceae bacterium]|jgi:putative endonuclease|nr:hypothetical protein [Rickettsiaceae bacterium]
MVYRKQIASDYFSSYQDDMIKNKKSTYQFGVMAETFSVLYLRLKFYTILERRYKTHMGEVDIIARRGNRLVFVEVKARKESNNIYEAISPSQKARIKRAAEVFLFHNKKFANNNARFDVIFISPKFLIKHITNAWE